MDPEHIPGMWTEAEQKYKSNETNACGRSTSAPTHIHTVQVYLLRIWEVAGAGKPERNLREHLHVDHKDAQIKKKKTLSFLHYGTVRFVQSLVMYMYTPI